ncbi:GWT1-domain-containing protein [Pisolithus croceorrhizus]|nr:GWT1-domain-containing protein [Pisolithus croceorrhizus]KAI6132879.1 GWT1-domain-containing protein [Pisolithus croceorrhizus]
MHGDYKTSKEAFVSGATGSTVLHITAICSVALSSIALHSALTSRVAVFRSTSFFVEWILLSVPLLLSMTVYAEAPGVLSVLLSVATAVLLLLPSIENGTALPTRVDDGTTSTRDIGDRSAFQASLPPLRALSTYRAHMMLMTVLSILAVDFQVFPRALAKCETYGVSLMDLGVGSFVFSQGIISAIPLLKDPSRLRKPLGYKLFDTLKKVAPVAILGLIRLMAVKGTDYPEHVTEYGVHWNFFVTLSLLPLLEVFTHRVIFHMPVALLGLWIGVVQQCLLSFAGLGDILLNAPRSNVVFANKEGLISLLGYFSIHIMGLSVGTIILPPRPSFFRKQIVLPDDDRSTSLDLVAPRQTTKTVAELFSYAFVWWGLFAFVRLKLDVSRRMVNLPYVLWLSAFNTSFILGYCLLDFFFFPARISRVKDSSDPAGKRLILEECSAGSRAPLLLEAINKNSLVIFLIANVATGLINLSVKTMYASDGKALLILGGYAYCLCAFAWLFRNRRLWRF